MTKEFHEVAERMWKDELGAGLKPKEKRMVQADTSSIWSRSTASTMASRTSKRRERQAGTPLGGKIRIRIIRVVLTGPYQAILAH